MHQPLAGSARLTEAAKQDTKADDLSEVETAILRCGGQMPNCNSSERFKNRHTVCLKHNLPHPLRQMGFYKNGPGAPAA